MDAHAILDAIVRQKVGIPCWSISLIVQIVLIGRVNLRIALHACLTGQDVGHHAAGVVYMDNGLFLDGGITAATVGEEDGASLNIKVGLIQFRQVEAVLALVGDHFGKGCCMVFIIPVIDLVGYLAFARSWLLHIVEVTITTGEELSDKYLLGIRCGVSGIINLCAQMHITVVRIIDIVCIASQLRRKTLANSFCRTYLTGNVVTAIYLVDDDIVGSVLTVDMHERIAAHISHTCAAEHPASWVCIRNIILRVNHGADVAGFHRHLCAAFHLSFVAAAVYITTNLNLPLRYNRAQEYKYQYGNVSSHPTSV